MLLGMGYHLLTLSSSCYVQHYLYQCHLLQILVFTVGFVWFYAGFFQYLVRGCHCGFTDRWRFT